MEDSTNERNIKMLFLYSFAFIIVIVMILGCGILFGAEQISSVYSPYDRPRASVCFHDHRL